MIGCARRPSHTQVVRPVALAPVIVARWGPQRRCRSVQIQRGERPPARGVHRGRGDATPASDGSNSVTNLACAGRRQSQTYPRQPSASRGFLYQELGPPATVPLSDCQVLDDRLGAFEAIRQGHLNEPPHRWVQRHLEHRRQDRRSERPQSQLPGPDCLAVYQPGLDEHYRTFAGPRRSGTLTTCAAVAAERAA